MSDAGFEVRITPLLRGVPGQREIDIAGVTQIAIEETTLVEQFADIDVAINLNEGRTGRVTLSMYDPAVAGLGAYEFAVRIGFARPNDQPEVVLFAQSNLTEDYEAGTVTLEIADPAAAKAQHHYIRRGDRGSGGPLSPLLLNIDKHRGRLPMHAESISEFLEAARNTQEQQDREVPVLGLSDVLYGTFNGGAMPDDPMIEFERGQEVWDLISQITRSAIGPDMDPFPGDAWTWPIKRSYAWLALYDPPTDPAAPGPYELGRNLDPVDPDDPQPGEVVFDYGLGLDNVTGLTVTPGRPTTHAHVVDADKQHRETRADAAASEDVGVWTDWIETDFALPRGNDTDTAPLAELAAARIRAYGRPPKFFTLTLRPVDALPAQFGHPEWFSVVTGERIGGQWYLGDYVRVRAERGYRSFSTLARIVGVRLRQEGWNGLPTIEVSMIPAIGGDPGLDPDEGV